MTAFLAASGNEGYGIFGILTLLAILGFLHWQICIRSFGLITHLPDNVSRWFGQAGERLGEDQHHGNLVGGLVRNVESRAQVIGGAGLLPRPGGGGGGGGGGGQQPTSGTPNPTGAGQGAGGKAVMGGTKPRDG